jgi:hypothetical protein
LRAIAHDYSAGSRREFPEFGKRITYGDGVAGFQFDADEKDPFRPRVSGFDECLQLICCRLQNSTNRGGREFIFIFQDYAGWIVAGKEKLKRFGSKIEQHGLAESLLKNPVMLTQFVAD